MQQMCNVLPASVDCESYWLLVAGLLAVCWAYNKLIDWLFEEGWGSLTVLLQAGGDLIVMFFFGLIYSWEAAGVSLSLFMFSGLYMMWGAFRRNQKRREDDRKATEEATNLAINGRKDG